MATLRINKLKLTSTDVPIILMSQLITKIFLVKIQNSKWYMSDVGFVNVNVPGLTYLLKNIITFLVFQYCLIGQTNVGFLFYLFILIFINNYY